MNLKPEEAGKLRQGLLRHDGSSLLPPDASRDEKKELTGLLDKLRLELLLIEEPTPKRHEETRAVPAGAHPEGSGTQRNVCANMPEVTQGQTLG